MEFASRSPIPLPGIWIEFRSAPAVAGKAGASESASASVQQNFTSVSGVSIQNSEGPMCSARRPPLLPAGIRRRDLFSSTYGPVEDLHPGRAGLHSRPRRPRFALSELCRRRRALFNSLARPFIDGRRSAHASNLARTTFGYGNHIPPCASGRTPLSWSWELDDCTDEGPGWSRGPAPLALVQSGCFAVRSPSLTNRPDAP